MCWKLCQLVPIVRVVAQHVADVLHKPLTPCSQVPKDSQQCRLGIGRAATPAMTATPSTRSVVLVFAATMLLFGSACTGASSDAGDDTGNYPGYKGAGTDAPAPFDKGGLDCFYDGVHPELPAATIEHTLEVYEGVDAVHVRLTLDPRFVDNTYGANAIGWEDSKKGKHTFKELVGSDHAQLQLRGADGALVEMKIDYVSEDSSAPSGYRSLGVHGGDGKVLEGDIAHVLSTSTSLDRNLNERGLGMYTVDSPETDESYTPHPTAGAWDYRVVYEARVDLAAFPGGFDRALVEFIHASPAKGDDNTIVVEPDDCPDDWCNDPDGCDPGGCNDPDGCDPGGCTDPNGCDPEPDPECVNNDDCDDGEFCAEDGTCLPYVE